jgi:pyroglutamyl-peptidase
MRTVLLTGFEPFDGESINPSWEAARALDGELIGGGRIHARLLPCAFGESLRVLRKEMRVLRPDLVLCVGQAGGRAAVTPERVAINIDDARIADNAGRQLADQPIVRGGPAAYWSTLPIKAIVAALSEARIPAAVSQTAGTFVCNHVFYGLMHALAHARRRPRPRGGFIHIPYLPAQARRKEGAPSLSLGKMIAAVRLAVAISLQRPRDAREAAGATH